MLINFKVKNFLSLKDLQTLSMVSGPTKRMSERIAYRKKFGILKFSAIYGANASGKSNVIKGLDVMKKIVTIGLPKFVSEFYFKLDNNTAKDSTYFEVDLSFDNKNYAYGFQVNFSRNEIVDEWLIELTNDKEIVIFERDLNNYTIKHMNFPKKTQNSLDVYTNDVKKDKTILFLSYLNNNKKGFYELENTEIFKKIYTWFDEYLNVVRPDTSITSMDYIIVDEQLQLLKNLLNYFDTGINDILIEKSTQEEVLRKIPIRILDDIKEELTENLNNENSEKKRISSLIRFQDDFIIMHMNEDKTFSYEKVSFYHEGVPLSLDQESDGTIRLLDIAEILLTDTKNMTFVIDELDRCLHPQITCKFVEYFLKRAEDENFNNQLIVTTHESRLLDFGILRRDEIWFTDKKNGETSLYSLEQFNERFDKKIDKAYLDGRYGGVPIFDNIFPTFSNIDSNENKSK